MKTALSEISLETRLTCVESRFRDKNLSHLIVDHYVDLLWSCLWDLAPRSMEQDLEIITIDVDIMLLSILKFSDSQLV